MNATEVLGNYTPVPESGCWLWDGAVKDNGYGMVRWKSKAQHAHRVTFELTVGEIPDGMCVCHKCDVPMCVNPNHLFLGTQADNISDMMKKGRSRGGKFAGTQCPKGHPRDVYSVRYGKRRALGCRICYRERNRASKARLKALQT